MRVWLLKFMGLVLWSVFLFAPFIARADDGFSTMLPFETNQSYMKKNGVKKNENFFEFGGVKMGVGGMGLVDPSAEGQWSLQINAGKDSVLTNDFSNDIKHDRIPLDDGERDSFRFGLGLQYKF